MATPSCRLRAGLIASALLLGACTVMPTGPSVMVLPGSGQSFDRFRDDDAFCRQYAHYQIGGLVRYRLSELSVWMANSQLPQGKVCAAREEGQ